MEVSSPAILFKNYPESKLFDMQTVDASFQCSGHGAVCWQLAQKLLRIFGSEVPPRCLLSLYELYCSNDNQIEFASRDAHFDWSMYQLLHDFRHPFCVPLCLTTRSCHRRCHRRDVLASYFFVPPDLPPLAAMVTH